VSDVICSIVIMHYEWLKECQLMSIFKRTAKILNIFQQLTFLQFYFRPVYIYEIKFFYAERIIFHTHYNVLICSVQL